LKASDILQRESFPVASPARANHPRSKSGTRQLSRRQLVINGRFLEQSITGVQRVSREVTREIDALVGTGEFSLEVTLLHPRSASPAELELRHIRTQAVGKLHGAAWEQFVLPRAAAGRPLLCLGNSAPFSSLLSKDPVGVMIHDLSYLDHPRAYRPVYRWSHRALLPLLLLRASKLFVVSETERERLAGLWAGTAHRIVVAPNGGWSERPEERTPAAPLPPLPTGYALFVGSLSHRKNFDRLLQTAITLAREDDIPFVFAGSSGSVLTKPRIEIPSDVAERIVFVGQVDDRATLGELYQRARLLVFPSLYEASPLPPFEAAHFGCPVVASNIPSIWERCDDGVTYCNPRSVDSIVSAARRVLRAPEVRERQIAINGRRAARMSWREQARTILAAMSDRERV
jgi:glycosyltransferase involved in cell wall biosynthesis